MGVIIGMDPHKASATIEVIDEHGVVIGRGRFGTDREGSKAMLAEGRRQHDRTWAVEGCRGIGQHIAHRLVHDGEMVLDVPPRLSAQVRVYARGNGRMTDPVDAHSVAMAALRGDGLQQVVIDEELIVLGMLADRCDELGRARTQTANRLRRLLLELFPGGAQRSLSAKQARALLATIRPRDMVGQTRRRLAVELIGETETLDSKTKKIKKELAELVVARGSSLLELPGIGPSGAARLLADVGDVHRFATRDRFASWNDTAPLDASSGEQNRHHLSRAGNQRINRVLHIMAVVQLRHPGPGHSYYNQKKAGGMASMMAMRALKRRLSNVVYAHMLEDQKQLGRTMIEAGPGGHSGTTLHSSATDLTPDIGSSKKPHPGPAAHDLKTDVIATVEEYAPLPRNAVRSCRVIAN